MLGHQLIYLEGGSGVSSPIPEETVKAVKKNISVPLIVGGGVHSESDALKLYNAGADIVVVGNAIEKKTDLIVKISQLCQ